MKILQEILWRRQNEVSVVHGERNVPDDVLKRVTSNDGIVMVTFIPDFVSEERRQWAVELGPITKDMTTEAEWKAAAEDYKKTHGQPPLMNFEEGVR